MVTEEVNSFTIETIFFIFRAKEKDLFPGRQAGSSAAVVDGGCCQKHRRLLPEHLHRPLHLRHVRPLSPRLSRFPPGSDHHPRSLRIRLVRGAQVRETLCNRSDVSDSWLRVSFYEELKEIEALSQKETEDIKQVREAYESELAVRRRKARSMTERQPLHMLDDGRNLISASTIENMLQQLSAQLDRKTSRSLDTMLGLMAAEAEKDDILSLYDDFYTTDESLSVAERTRKLLKLTALEIQEARRRKEERREDGLLKSKSSGKCQVLKGWNASCY